MHIFGKLTKHWQIMNYKKIFPNRSLRLKILKWFDFVPDKQMIQLQYRLATGRKLNLKDPKRFTEKIQWYKLYYRDPLMIQCSDKYLVRDYVEEKGLKDILVPLYGVYEDPEQIDFSNLPQKFVLKTTNGSHTNILCENKDKLDYQKAIDQMKKWLKTWSGKMGREWAYHGITPRIICEKYLEKDRDGDIIDYKFHCFHGEPYCLYVAVERFLPGGLKFGIFDSQFNLLPYRRSDIKGLDREISKPRNFEKMVEIARTLSRDFPHVRVDLYNIDGDIYFGELTFYDGSGYQGYVPDDFDFYLGRKFIIKEK